MAKAKKQKARLTDNLQKQKKREALENKEGDMDSIVQQSVERLPGVQPLSEELSKKKETPAPKTKKRTTTKKKAEVKQEEKVDLEPAKEEHQEAWTESLFAKVPPSTIKRLNRIMFDLQQELGRSTAPKQKHLVDAALHYLFDDLEKEEQRERIIEELTERREQTRKKASL